jgi:hypothetical protein
MSTDQIYDYCDLPEPGNRFTHVFDETGIQHRRTHAEHDPVTHYHQEHGDHLQAVDALEAVVVVALAGQFFQVLPQRKRQYHRVLLP